MIFTAGNILLIGSILLFVSIIVGKTGYRFGEVDGIVVVFDGVEHEKHLSLIHILASFPRK